MVTTTTTLVTLYDVFLVEWPTTHQSDYFGIRYVNWVGGWKSTFGLRLDHKLRVIFFFRWQKPFLMCRFWRRRSRTSTERLNLAVVKSSQSSVTSTASDTTQCDTFLQRFREHDFFGTWWLYSSCLDFLLINGDTWNNIKDNSDISYYIHCVPLNNRFDAKRAGQILIS